MKTLTITNARSHECAQAVRRISVALSLLCAFFLAFGEDRALAVPLSSLVSGGSLTQGDKVFNNFSGSLDIGLGTFSPASIGGINVQGVTASGNHGLQFSGPFSTSGTSLSVLNYLIQYDVSVAGPTSQITGFSSSLLTPSVTSDGEIFLAADVSRATNGTLLGSATLASGVPQSGGTFAATGLSTVRVNHDLLLFSEGGSASLAGFQTTFSQGPFVPGPGGVGGNGNGEVIPEPSTVLLVATGLIGIGLARRRGLSLIDVRSS